MVDFIDSLLTDYGQWAMLFLLLLSGFGVAVGEDLIVIPAGIFIAEGRWNFTPTWLVAYVGVLMGDLLWFTWCYRLGKPLLHKRWFKRIIHPRRLLEMKHQFDVRGGWVIVFARFIPGTRTTAITVAGLLHMPFWRFLIAEMACIVLTVTMQISIGMLIYHGYKGLTQENAKLVFWILGAVVAVVALVLIVRMWVRRERKTRPKRAKARWLRLPRRKKAATSH